MQDGARFKSYVFTEEAIERCQSPFRSFWEVRATLFSGKRSLILIRTRTFQIVIWRDAAKRTKSDTMDLELLLNLVLSETRSTSEATGR